jgi:hypothetical protein
VPTGWVRRRPKILCHRRDARCSWAVERTNLLNSIARWKRPEGAAVRAVAGSSSAGRHLDHCRRPAPASPEPWAPSTQVPLTVMLIAQRPFPLARGKAAGCLVDSRVAPVSYCSSRGTLRW